MWDKHDLSCLCRARALTAGGCKLITLLLKGKLFLVAISGTSVIACALGENTYILKGYQLAPWQRPYSQLNSST